MSALALVHSSTTPEVRTSARKDVRPPAPVRRAEKLIGEYARLIEGAFVDSDPFLISALAATYTAVLDLQKHPEVMAMYLSDRRSGPISRNPIKPIVRKLWKGVHTRDTLHRYASCLAFAEREQVKPADFPAWIKTTTIKKAAASWARTERSPEERQQAERDQRDKAVTGLDRLTPFVLPEQIAAGLSPGSFMCVLRVTAEQRAELFMFPEVAPGRVDSFIVRESRR